MGFQSKVHVWKRTQMKLNLPGVTSVVTQIKGLVAKAHKEYDVEALAVYLGYVREEGLIDTGVADGELGELELASNFLDQLHLDYFVEDLIHELCEQAAPDKNPAIEVLVRLMNILNHQKRLEGRNLPERLRVLQEALARRAQDQGLGSIFE